MNVAPANLPGLVLATLALALSTPARADDPPPDDRKRIEATWQITGGEEKGKTLAASLFTGQTVTFDATTYVIKVGDRVVEKGSYKLDSTRDPKTFDLEITESETDRDKTQLGIYKFQGDTLKMSFSRPGATTRPTRFETTADSATFTLELKRKRSEP